ncbi:sugar ABC transporter substrate-binding protein [Leifsonia sp. ku-ls]|nr:sugar ABC transporter substrate-binding protein [Leifsonia sp. ku-ls]
MRSSRRLLAVTGLGAAVALLAAGCASGSDASAGSGDITGEVTLQTWSLTPKFTDYLNGVIDGFEKKYPGTKVTLLDQPGDGYSDKVLSQAASNTLPDVINLPPDFALPLAQQGLLEDVSTHGDLAKTYVPGGISAYQFASTKGTFGYPWYLNTDLNWWNASQLDACGLDAAAPPKTQQELFAAAEKAHTACPDTYLLSRKPGVGDFVLEGVPVLNSDGTKFVFNTEKAAKLLDQYRDAYKGGLMPSSVLNNDYLGNSKLFTQGKVAWTTGGATSYKDFTTDNPSLKDHVTVSPALNTPPLYVQGLSVSKKSKHLATAVALAQWVTNAKNQNAFGHLVNVFPSTIASADDPYFSKDDGTIDGKARVLAFTSLKKAKNLQPYEINSAMSDYLNQQIALAIKGDIPSKEALDKAVAKLNQLLARQ